MKQYAGGFWKLCDVETAVANNDDEASVYITHNRTVQYRDSIGNESCISSLKHYKPVHEL